MKKLEKELKNLKKKKSGGVKVNLELKKRELNSKVEPDLLDSIKSIVDINEIYSEDEDK